jgi:flagellar biosynthesis chaperone FliJ
MAFQLQSLLDLRRNAESDAKAVLDVAIAARATEEEEQVRLVARLETARAALEGEVTRCAAAPAPVTAAEATRSALYRERLREDAKRRARNAENHKVGALAAALVEEDEARTAYKEAHEACQAVEKLKERAEAEEKKQAERQAESAAGDLAQAAHFRKRLE